MSVEKLAIIVYALKITILLRNTYNAENTQKFKTNKDDI
jgi:hypothetical protein